MSYRLLLTASVLASALVPLSADAVLLDLYVSDPGSGAIFEFTPTGVQSTLSERFPHNGFNNPFGLAINARGSIFTCIETTSLHGVIVEFTSTRVRSRFATTSEPTLFLAGLAFDSAGSLFAADFVFGRVGQGRILQFTPSGAESVFATDLNHPYGLAFDSTGNLFEADQDSGRILRFTPSGAESVFATGLKDPTGLAFDSAGNLFVAESGSRRILEFTTTGTQSTFASGLFPLGLAFDSADNLFVADYVNGTILEFSPSGAESTFATGLHSPAFLAFGPASASVLDVGATLGLLAMSVFGLLLARKMVKA
jgi:Gluconolactonase